MQWLERAVIGGSQDFNIASRDIPFLADVACRALLGFPKSCHTNVVAEPYELEIDEGNKNVVAQ